VCRAEFRLLKEVQPQYAGRVNFLAVGIDGAESADVLRAYREAQGYPWPVALAGRETLERYSVTSTSIKYGIDRNGLVAFHAGYGVNDAARWERWFEELAAR
jgi:hypothetical protein